MRLILSFCFLTACLSCKKSETKVDWLKKIGRAPITESSTEKETATKGLKLEKEEQNSKFCSESGFENTCLKLALERSENNKTQVYYSLSEMKPGEPVQFQFKTCLISLIGENNERATLGSFNIQNDSNCSVEGSFYEDKAELLVSGEVPEMDFI